VIEQNKNNPLPASTGTFANLVCPDNEVQLFANIDFSGAMAKINAPISTGLATYALDN